MKLRNLAVGLIAVFLGLVAGAIIMFLTGANAFQGYASLFRGGLMSVERIGNTLATATPLILTGLSVAFAFRTGLFNIGAAGQMLMGGLCASAIGLTTPLPKELLLPLMILAAMAAGGIWGAIPGFLKARFNVHEVVSTIMLNQIAHWIVYYTVQVYFKGEFETESRKISDVASLKVQWMTQLFQGSYINLGFFLSIIAVVIVAIILNRTVLGYELKAVGFNRHAAEYAGMNVGKNIALSMGIAGALSGIAGATFYVGYATSMQIDVIPSQGSDGIAVALLSSNSPVGAVASALFFGLLHSGKGFMSATTNIPPEIGDIIIATILYFAATSVLIVRLLEYLSSRRRMSKNLRESKVETETAVTKGNAPTKKTGAQE